MRLQPSRYLAPYYHMELKHCLLPATWAPKMQRVALIPLLPLQPIDFLTITTDNRKMDNGKPAVTRRDDKGTAEMSLHDRGDQEEPNLNCDKTDEERQVTCSHLPFADCCQAGENELSNSTNHNHTEGWTSFTICSGNNRAPYRTRTGATSSSDTKCLASGESGLTVPGAAMEGSTGDGDGGNDDDAAAGENRGGTEPKKRAVRANLYAYRIAGTIYHITINSPLGEAYRNLSTKAEQREFMIRNGAAKPYVRGICLRVAP